MSNIAEYWYCMVVGVAIGSTLATTNNEVYLTVFKSRYV